MRMTLFAAMLITANLTAWGDVRIPQNSTGIMCCEQYGRRVLLMDENVDWNQPSAILWEWPTKHCEQIAPEHRMWFANVTDAKRVMNGTHVIVSASGGGVALVRMEDKHVVFYALADGNTHSIELLPDGNLVSASSTGSYLRVFCTDTAVSHPPLDVKYSDVPLDDAHGVAWDFQKQRLWAIGGTDLVRYQYNGDRANPQLTEDAKFELPDAGGHDLFPVPGTRKLFLTAGNSWTFDTENESFEPIPSIGGPKSISQREPGGPIIVMEATEVWWSDTIRFVGEDRKMTLNKAKFYKARWWVPNTFSYGPDEQ